MIKAVTFDFWSTLYISDSGTEAARAQLRFQRLQKLPHLCDIPPIRLSQKYELALQMALIGRFEPYPPEVARHLLRDLNLHEDGELAGAVARIIEEAALDVPPVMVPGADEVMAQLAGSYQIGLVSDTGMTIGRVLRQIMADDGLAQYFSAYVFSDETGCRKPEPRQFLSVASQLGVEPGEMVHVGDLMDTDVAGAHDAGARAILYTGHHDEQHDKHLADAVISDHAELPAIIARWNAG